MEKEKTEGEPGKEAVEKKPEGQEAAPDDAAALSIALEQQNAENAELSQKLEAAKEDLERERFSGFSATVDQVTTRGDGRLELGAEFGRDDVDFGSALDHLRIHTEGEVAGSQFNGDIVRSPKDLEVLLKKLLPEKLQYDQHNRAEITLDVSHEGEGSLGYSGVKSVEEIQQQFPDAEISEGQRIPGGIEDVVDGVAGAWYPETAWNPATKRPEVVKDEEGNVKNPKGKFEPRAKLVKVPKAKYRELSKTDKITVIIQLDKSTNRPKVLTVFPGENAPPYPAKIDSADYKASTLGKTQETKFWDQHAFVQAE